MYRWPVVRTRKFQIYLIVRTIIILIMNTVFLFAKNDNVLLSTCNCLCCFSGFLLGNLPKDQHIGISKEHVSSGE